MSQRLRDKSARHDHFHQRARKAGFAARSVYKLEELDQKFRLFKPGARVLDLGCRPGSWLQYARTRIGDAAPMVGLDRTPLDIVIPGARNVSGDVMEVSAEELRGELPGFDVVLSDMAPDTTGVRALDQARSEGLFERALELAEATLLPGGNFVGKLFQGPDWKRLCERVRARFSVQKTFKPDSSRKDSIEQYVVGLGFRGR